MNTRTISRVAIANRGEAAVRLVHAVHELGEERGGGLRAIALFADSDARSSFVREADVAVALGAALVDDGAGRRRSVYVDGPRVLAAALSAQADAIWIGWGFLAADPAFARSCQEHGLTFVGPPAEVLERLSDPPTLARLAAGLGLETGAPPPRSRRLDVQVAGDASGTVLALGVLDGTVRRAGQVVVAEAPSPALAPAVESALGDASVRLAVAAGLAGLATFEWAVLPDGTRPLLLGARPHLQAEHPVTELTSGLDLAKLQLAIAAGERLPSAAPSARGHAVAVTLRAEDPDAGFAPSGGEVEVFTLSPGTAVRVETGVAARDTIVPELDPLLARIVAHGTTRAEAIARLRRTLARSSVLVRGGVTNKSFLHELLGDADFVACRTDSEWLERRSPREPHGARPQAEVALLYAAVLVHESEQALAAAAFAAGAQRGRAAASDDAGTPLVLGHQGQAYALVVHQVDATAFELELDGRRHRLDLEQHGQAGAQVSYRGERHRVVSVVEGDHLLVEVDGLAHAVEREQSQVVRAPSPAIVLSVAVAAGSPVAAGDVLVTLEAMKMEIPVRAPSSGVVRALHVTPNRQVSARTPLVELEPLDHPTKVGSGTRLDFGAPPPAAPATPADLTRAALTALRAFLLGFDVSADEVRSAMRRAAPHLGLVDDHAELAELEGDILQRALALAVLYRRPEAPGHTPAPSPIEQLVVSWRTRDDVARPLDTQIERTLVRTLEPYGIRTLTHSRVLERTLLRVHLANGRLRQHLEPLLTLLGRPRRVDLAAGARAAARLRVKLERLVAACTDIPAIADLARRVRHRHLDRPLFEQARQDTYRALAELLEALALEPERARAEGALTPLIECPQSLLSFLAPWFESAKPALRAILLEVFLRRYYSDRALEHLSTTLLHGRPLVTAHLAREERGLHLVAASGTFAELAELLEDARGLAALAPAGDEVALDFIVTLRDAVPTAELTTRIKDLLAAEPPPPAVSRVCVSVLRPAEQAVAGHLSFACAGGVAGEASALPDVHPVIAERLELGRLSNFVTRRLPSPEDVFLFHAVARDNPKDERLFAFLNVRDLTAVRDESGRVAALPHLEQLFLEAAAAIRDHRAQNPQKSLHWNRILMYLRPPATLRLREVRRVIWRIAQSASDIGLEKVVARVRLRDTRTDGILERVLHLSVDGGKVVRLRLATPSDRPIRTLDTYKLKVAEARRRGMTYPYEIVRMLTPREVQAPLRIPPGSFVEYDLDQDNQLIPVDRPFGENHANMVVGVIRNELERYAPEGLRRVIILSDPTREMGAIAEPECRRLIAALNLALAEKLPVDWFPICAGAKIAMDSGTENLDWTARAIRRLVEVTQAGLEINVVVDGVNVGAQSYWNAEATMLMHTRGILIMTPEASMVLTGKLALDYSGAVSADDHQGIGGLERIMGPNGQAQYAARDLTDACELLMRHHELTYLAPGERFPRRFSTRDPSERAMTTSPYADDEGLFSSIGEIFAGEKNAAKKKPFDIRQVMRAVSDADQEPLERWPMMRNAEIAVVWDTSLGGHCVSLIGIESRRLAREGFVPADGPGEWTGGTLFPLSSKKVARAINSASGRRPVVILANLSGFDGSPESMRKLQLEYGAEIGRAVVNFDGPIVFCVISRYHGGAYVVFSGALNEGVEVAALQGTYASVIGGAPAAAVVFARDVRALTNKDPRVVAARKAIEQAGEASRAREHAELEDLVRTVYNEKLGEVAEKFDRIHTIDRACEVGSLQNIVAPEDLRPYLVAAVERGMDKYRRR